ncbi:MAG: hypothetical protein HY794_13225 [Desulfarculus sp.]|nr:hypothetical protein [Desulfarculus sp.]
MLQWLKDKIAGGPQPKAAVALAGVTYNNPDGVSRQEILARMQQWETVDLVREPSNPHDKDAIAVVGGMGQIGWVTKNMSGIIAEPLDAGCSVLAKLASLGGGGDKPYGGKLEIHLTPPPGAVSLHARVVGITGKDSQGNSRRELAEYGTRAGQLVLLGLDYEADWENSQVTVDIAGDNLGRLGKKDAAIVAPMLEEGFYIFASIFKTEMQDDKPKVTVAIVGWKSR